MLEGISPARASVASNESSRPSQGPRNKAGTDIAPVRPENRQPSSEAKQAPVDVETAVSIAAELNSALKQVQGGDFSVSVDGDTGMIVVRISDKDTHEIVKQIPPQELVDADIRMERIIGLLVDDEA